MVPVVSPRDQYIGSLQMAATAFLWSLAGLFIKAIDWNPFYIAMFRSATAALFIVIAVRRFSFSFSWPLVGAALANALTMILFISANKTTTAANAILLQYMAPIITSLLGVWLLKEKLGWESAVALGVITVGLVIMVMDKVSYGTTLGNVLALLSAVTFSFYFIFMRMLAKESTLEAVLLSHLCAVMVCAVIAAFLPLPKFTLISVGAVLILGVFQVGITALLFAAAIKKISASTAVLIAVIEPVFNPLWVFLVLGEKPGTNAVVGGGFIVLAATLASLASARRTKA